MQVDQYYSSSSEFIVAYEGDPLSDNAMSVRDLAPALLAMDELFQRSNGLLNANATSASLKVRAHHQGSFEIDFALDVSPLFAAMFGGDYLASATNILRLLFGGSTPGLFTLIKKLRGRSHSVTDSSSDSLVIEADWIRAEGIGEAENFRMVVPPSVIRLSEDSNIRRAAFNILSPLQRDGIDQMVVRDKNEELERIIEDDVPSFVVPSQGNILGEAVTRQFLVIDTTRLSARSRQWRFFDGNKINSYSMRDEEFINSIMRREVGFLAGDIFECEVRSVQRMGPRGEIKTELEILRVLGRRPPTSGGTQPTLDL